VRIHLLPLLLAFAACTDPTTPGAEGSTGATSTAGTGTTGTTDTPTSTTSDAPTSTTSTESTGTTNPTTDTTDPTDTADPWTPARCYDGWDLLTDTFPDAGPLVDCEGAGFTVQRSCWSSTASRSTTTAPRCSRASRPAATRTTPTSPATTCRTTTSCQTTPNALNEAPTLLRIPLAPALPGDDLEADGPEIQDSCIDAYDQFLDSGQATAREPSHLCLANQNDVAHLRETLASGDTVTTTKIACLGTTAILNSGVVVVGPNEAGMPDPFGNPMFFMPDNAGEPYLPDDLGMGAALDLCGGHTGGSMHYHGANLACFEQADDGTPANSYATASQAWDLDTMLHRRVHRSPRRSSAGAPTATQLKAPACAPTPTAPIIKRVRSAWVYAASARGATTPARPPTSPSSTSRARPTTSAAPAAQLQLPLLPVLVADDGPDGTIVESPLRPARLLVVHPPLRRPLGPPRRRQVRLPRPLQRPTRAPDGYAYHATLSFPYIQACYRGVPAEIAAQRHDDDDGGPMEGGMDPPMCMQGQTMMCCGDDVCGGPETAMNCPEDCG
jgi:hypothetical protein